MHYSQQFTIDQIDELRRETLPSTLKEYVFDKFSNSNIYIVGFRESGDRFGSVAGAFFKEDIATRLLEQMYPGKIPVPFASGVVLCGLHSNEILNALNETIPDSTRQDFVSVKTPKNLEEGNVFDFPFNRGSDMDVVETVYDFLNTHLHTSAGPWKPC